MNEDKAARYHRLKRRSAALALAVRAGMLAAFVAVAVRPTGVEHLVRAFGLPVIVDVALVAGLYALVLAVVSELLALPFVCYAEFLLERRFGLSRDSFNNWFRAHVKSASVGLAFWPPAAALAYGAIQAWPEVWWGVAAGMFLVLTVLQTHLAPVLLLPLFYTMRPLQRPALRTRLEALARRAGAPVIGVHEWRLGAHNATANAALIGIGPTRRVLVSDTLLEDYSDDEIEVVIAHEFAHHVHHDIWQTIAYEALVALAAFWSADAVMTVVGARVGVHGIQDPTGLPVLAFVAGGIATASRPAANMLSRWHERRADRYALEVTGNREAFVSGLRRLGAQNLAEERPSRLVEWLFHTHPSLSDRMADARADH